jgi:hypothetical protein
MLDKNVIYSIVASGGSIIFIMFALMTAWLGSKLWFHAKYALQGTIPAGSWFGRPLQDSRIETSEKSISIRIFQLVTWGLFIFSGFLALSIPAWIIYVYFQIF